MCCVLWVYFFLLICSARASFNFHIILQTVLCLWSCFSPVCWKEWSIYKQLPFLSSCEHEVYVSCIKFQEFCSFFILYSITISSMYLRIATIVLLNMSIKVTKHDNEITVCQSLRETVHLFASLVWIAYAEVTVAVKLLMISLSLITLSPALP